MERNINYKNHIERIINSIHHNSSENWLLINKNKLNFSTFDNYSEIIHGLSTILYNDFYCKGTSFSEFNQVEGNKPLEVEEDKFLSELNSNNLSENKFNEGWNILNQEKNGSVLAQKHNFIRLQPPGEYIKMKGAHRIKIWNDKEWSRKSKGFYYVFSDTLGDSNGANQVRIYFNILPIGSKVLINNLTDFFNKHKIPFQFKCLKKTSHYNRADPAVLYIDKCYLNFSLRIIRLFYNNLKPFLRNGIPLFCKQIAKGVGFAESPPNIYESFGTSRVSLISQAIIKSSVENISQNNWIKEVLKNIKTHNLDIKKFYLNPQSSYPYKFIYF